jgi:hypothetical protein
VRRADFGRGDKPGICQATQRPTAALRAFENSAGNVPPGRMFFSADRERVTSSLQRNFHVRQSS